jgi:exopolysaccharide biosynthesis polyprenyl glycosylphosphotransferase
MLRREKQIFTRLQKGLDALLFCAAFWVTHWVRNLPALDPRGQIQEFNNYAWLLFIIFPLTPLLLEVNDFYMRPVLGNRRQRIWALFKASLWITVISATAVSLVKTDLPRGVVFTFGAAAFVVVAIKEELVLRWTLARMGSQGFRKRVVLVGAPDETERMLKQLKEASHGEVQIVDRVDLNQQGAGALSDALHEHSANAVIISPRQTLFGEIEKAIRVCEIEGVEVWLRADFFQTQISQTKAEELYGHPMLVFRTGPDLSWQVAAKSLMDTVGSFLLLIASSPIFVILFCVIKWSSPGPVFFRQKRAGLNGSPFEMLKFRTMVSNAEQLKQELLALNEMSGPVFKVTNDPRVTRVGRILRKYSLDELPQLINVLRGEMSLVGPRPLPVDEVRRFDDMAHRRRLSVKPGLTCLWQVSGRNNVSDFREWVRLDLEYIDNWTFWLDLKILWRTIPAVFSGAGAK